MNQDAADILRAAPRPDLSQRIVWLPIRHHSAACAFHVDAVIRRLRPSAVLIEGPRDATPLLRHLVDPAMSPPVAIFTTYTDRSGDGPPRRAAAYYPLCAYSPELVAVQAGHAVDAQVQFIDLTWPEMVQTERGSKRPSADADRPRSLQRETALRQGSWLVQACRRAGARDSDDLWDCWFEADGRQRTAEDFFHGVLAWCTACRLAHTADDIAAEGNLVRESGMRAEIERVLRDVSGQIVVITGGFHTVALPRTVPAMPQPVTIAREEDAGAWMMRYDFLQLDRLNGYASGMPSPAFWQWRWDNRSIDDLMITIARDLRGRTGAPSVADAAAAVAQLHRLAAFRDHAHPTRHDFLDAVTSCFIKGARDIEGVAILAQVRKILAGDRVGVVPQAVGRPPLVLDFERQTTALRLKLGVEEHGLDLDLYRSAAHRETSRFLHRLMLLEVPFARKEAGPDFTTGEDLHRVREMWRYQWHPGVEARLVEQSRYGATIVEAATAHLLELAEAAEHGDRRADRAARLVVESCRCGLHVQARVLLPRVEKLITTDGDVSSVIGAGNSLHLLVTGREPLEAHDMPEIDAGVLTAWTRAAYLITDLAKAAPEVEDAACEDLLSWSILADELTEPTCPALRRERLVDVSRGINPAVAGTAWGLLYDDGLADGVALGAQLAGHLGAATTDPSIGGRFLRGVLRAARSACWSEPAIIDAIHHTLRLLDEQHFVAALPHLRLAFAELPPRAVDHVAKMAADRSGLPAIDRHLGGRYALADVQIGRAADLLVRQALERDGLSDVLERSHA
ncbi:MAG: DUF5682 family protein [Planctomycetota bacterium]